MGTKARIGVGALAALLGRGGVDCMAHKHLLAGGMKTAAPEGGNMEAPTLVHGGSLDISLAEKS